MGGCVVTGSVLVMANGAVCNAACGGAFIAFKFCIEDKFIRLRCKMEDTAFDFGARGKCDGNNADDGVYIFCKNCSAERN